MRKIPALLALAACAHAPTIAVRDTTPAPPALPAGTCGFDPYLQEACTDAPSFAVVLSRTNDARAAERALRAMPARDGYPFVESFDVLPAADANVRGMGVFAGLYRDRRGAEARAAEVGGEVTPLATVDAFQRRGCAGAADSDACERSMTRVVQTSARTPAWDAADLERVEREIDEKWVPLPAQQRRRAAELAKLTPRCTIGPARVFVTNENAIYRFMRTYAPVVCDDGRPAWIPWRATRLESAVVNDRVHQVILVECDVPTLETRPLGPPSPEYGPLTNGRCD